MADERQLNVTTRLDASGIRAGMDAAAQAVKQGSDQMAASFATAAEASAALKRAQGDMASILKAVGGTINENNVAWGLYSAAQKEAADASAALAEIQAAAAAAARAAATAAREAAAAQRAAAAEARAMASAESYATTRMAASASGMGSMGFALGSVVRQSSTLRPILEGLFPVLLAGAFLDIVVNIGESVKNWYDNAVLLKQLNQDLLGAAESGADAAARANWQYVESVVGVRKALGDAAGAVSELRSNIADKPLKIDLKIGGAKDKDLEQAEPLLGGISKLIGEIRAVNTLGGAETLLGAIRAQSSAATEKLRGLQSQLASAQAVESAAATTGDTASIAAAAQKISQTNAQIQAVQTLAQALGSAQAQIVSAQGTAGNEIWQAHVEGAKKSEAAATRNANAVAEGQRKIAAAVAANQREQNQILARAQAQHTEAERAQLTEAEQGSARAARTVQDHIRETAADAKAAANEVFAQQQRDIAASAQLAIGAIQIRARAHDINAQQEQAQMEAVYRSEYDAQVAALKAELAALRESDKNYFAEKQRLFNEIDDAYNRLQANLQRSQAAPGAAKTPIPLDAQIAAKGITTMANDFSRMMDGVMTGTQRLSVAWRRMGAEMVAGWAAAMIQMAAKHLAMEITTTAQHAAAKQAQVAIDASAAGQSTGIDAVRSLKEITHAAGVAAAKAWSAVVGIPVIGPILAPPAAAASYAGVMAFGALTSAEGGQWRVPAAEQLTMLHRNEMVLPAVHAEALRQTVAGGGGGNTMHFHFAPTVHAVDSDGVESMLRNHAPKFAGAVHRHLRARNAV